MFKVAFERGSFWTRLSQTFAMDEYARALKRSGASSREDARVVHVASAPGLSRGAPYPVHCLAICQPEFLNSSSRWLRKCIPYTKFQERSGIVTDVQYARREILDIFPRLDYDLAANLRNGIGFAVAQVSGKAEGKVFKDPRVRMDHRTDGGEE